MCPTMLHNLLGDYDLVCVSKDVTFSVCGFLLYVAKLEISISTNETRKTVTLRDFQEVSIKGSC